MDISNKDRGFHWSSKAFYSNVLNKKDPAITFGIYPGDGDEGTKGEMSMVWVNLGKESAPRLQCFHDAFEVLASFSDLIYKLNTLKDQCFDEQTFIDILIDCGFRDLTKYKQP